MPNNIRVYDGTNVIKYKNLKGGVVRIFAVDSGHLVDAQCKGIGAASLIGSEKIGFALLTSTVIMKS